tara:strand:- start:298 stop:558 length:261 start_codon:yes stop_codon:yes gene_type:complete
MKVKTVPMYGIQLRALIVEAGDESQPCENCGKPMWHHEDLAKEDMDWCMNCNDVEHRAHLSDDALGLWTVDQHNKGKIVLVIKEDE